MAAGIGPIAQGNDIAGSVRFPAYCCGIVGLRVGLGRIPSFNHTAKIARGIGGQLMATQGPLTRTVRDARLALAVMAKGDRGDTRWVDVPVTGPLPTRPIRVALVPEVPGGATHSSQAEAVRLAGSNSSMTTRSLCYRHTATCRRPGVRIRRARGQRRLLQALRVGLIAPLFGLAGLALPVGAYGGLRTGVQIVPSRFREDFALDAGEVIEASEGIVTPIDPAW